MIDSSILLDPTKDTVWTSKDGKRTPVCLMNNGHLINSIKLMRRNGKTDRKIYERLMQEMDYRNLSHENLISDREREMTKQILSELGD